MGVLDNLATAYRDAGLPKEAMEACEQGLAIVENGHDRVAMLVNLGRHAAPARLASTSTCPNRGTMTRRSMGIHRWPLAGSASRPFRPWSCTPTTPITISGDRIRPVL
ncbi:hypothetical protein GCM10009733_097900 [Nonomuraea maheshkhaliensis]|uniref:Tetratricopeptide repeat protein n=1 Tax=Nonomuraea maheshkhaliensis TaxID=419590 RepID=A0ABP4TCC2_9ACTN